MTRQKQRPRGVHRPDVNKKKKKKTGPERDVLGRLASKLTTLSLLQSSAETNRPEHWQEAPKATIPRRFTQSLLLYYYISAYQFLYKCVLYLFSIYLLLQKHGAIISWNKSFSKSCIFNVTGYSRYSVSVNESAKIRVYWYLHSHHQVCLHLCAFPSALRT